MKVMAEAEIDSQDADREVRHGKSAGGGVAVLTVDADVAELAAGGLRRIFPSA